MQLKKLLYSILFGSTMLSAASSQYVGVSFIGGHTFIDQKVTKYGTGSTSEAIDPNLYGAKLNLGIDNGEDLRTNIYFGIEKFDKDIYSNLTNGSDGLLWSVGFDIIKCYDKKSSINPYLLGGIDYEFMAVDGYAQKWPNSVGLKFGGGTFLRMSDAIELQLGAYYKYRIWGNYNLDAQDTTNVELSDHSLMLELGLNFHY
ncbi:MAG: hypothetical protein MUP09_06085 [Thiovulaceae bacterium]|nr:hypothetical protein [Sulfurimonadaceae bacterium]